MSRIRTLNVGGIVALALFSLTACVGNTSSTPTPSAAISTPSATSPSSTPAAEPTPAEPIEIVLGGSTVSVADGSGAPVGDFDYQATAVGVVSSLTSLLGAPQTVVHQNEKCVADSVDNVWGGLTLSAIGPDVQDSVAFHILVTGDVPGAIIETQNGARVGASWPEYFAGVSDHASTTGEFEGKTWVEVIDSPIPTIGPNSGTLVNTADSAVISYIAAPSDLGHDC